jgi:hypothetical protein
MVETEVSLVSGTTSLLAAEAGSQTVPPQLLLLLVQPVEMALWVQAQHAHPANLTTKG